MFRWALKNFLASATISIARGEGEGDLTLADWRRGHRQYFTEEARLLGLAFDENTEVLTEWFEVLKVFGSV